ncbi:MAG: hypothetical protein ABIM40_10720, partial [Pseudomonadota bacterium]
MSRPAFFVVHQAVAGVTKKIESQTKKEIPPAPLFQRGMPVWFAFFLCQELIALQQVVIPAKAGIQGLCDIREKLDSGLRRNDGFRGYSGRIQSAKHPSQEVFGK